MIPRLSTAFSGPFDHGLKLASGSDQQGSDALSAVPSNDDTAAPRVTNLSDWQLHKSGVRCLARRPLELEKRFSAKHWLQKFRHDIFAMTTMRQVLLVEGWSTALPRLRPDQVIEQVAHLLESRRWHVCVPVIKLYPMNVLNESAPSAFSPIPRLGPRGSEAILPPPDVQEEPTLPVNADHAAIAAGMEIASQLGIPFCEECMRKALRKAVAPAVVA
jgi:hypothetical protein